MKWIAHIAALALLATTIGCGGNTEVEATSEGSGPTAEEMAKYAEETAKHMPQPGEGQSSPHAGKMNEMMKEAMKNAPGGSPPSQ